jgi:hypothetical protein|tara:strand:+ start:424 stop:849 length:426 start_codon:yes stop_codon:yes gene_type:complete
MKKGLCFRCEHRAVYLEEGHGPRFECQSETQTSFGCYCYKPVKPVSLVYPDYGNSDYDKLNKERPPTGGLIGARMQYHDIPQYIYTISEHNDVYIGYYIPIEDERYTLQDISDAWDYSYGEDLTKEYDGFVKILKERKNNG